MNDQIDMQGFLTTIRDCCKDIQTTWAFSFDLNPDPIKKLKETIQSYALNRGSDILSFYAFADGRGKYMFIDTCQVLDLVCRYETYHDDFFQFIKTVISPDWRISEEDEVCNYLQQGLKADRAFRKNLLAQPKIERLVVPEAIKNLDAIMALVLLLDKIYDAFIYLRSKIDEDSKKIITAIEMYSDSTLASVERLFILYMELIDALIKLRDRGEDITPKFKLI